MFREMESIQVEMKEMEVRCSERDGESTGGDEGDGGKMFREMESIQVEMKEMEVGCSERWRVYRWR